MSTTNGRKTPRIALKTPAHARKLIRRVLAEIFSENAHVESAGKVANLLTCWAKLYELEAVTDIEKRLATLEAERQQKQTGRGGKF